MEAIILWEVILMPKQKVKVTKQRVRKTGGKSGYKKCPRCGGDGRVKHEGVYKFGSFQCN